MLVQLTPHNLRRASAIRIWENIKLTTFCPSLNWERFAKILKGNEILKARKNACQIWRRKVVHTIPGLRAPEPTLKRTKKKSGKSGLYVTEQKAGFSNSTTVIIIIIIIIIIIPLQSRRENIRRQLVPAISRDYLLMFWLSSTCDPLPAALLAWNVSSCIELL